MADIGKETTFGLISRRHDDEKKDDTQKNMMLHEGAVGYIDFSGNMDTCIAIRTLVIKDGKAYAQAGGGVVYDSVPENEYQETVNKATALFLP